MGAACSAVAAAGWLFAWAFLSPESVGMGDSADALEGALFDPRATTPGFALIICVALLYLDRNALRGQLGQPARGWLAGALFVLGAFVTFWAHAIAAPDLARLAFVILALAVGFMLGGGGLARALVFPLVAILVSIPPPSMLAHQVLLPLQLATAKLSSGMLSLIGVDHVLVSDQIYKGGLVFYVIEGCSGYRAIFSLLLASTLYAGLVLTRLGERLALCALAPFVAFFVNGIRVTTLIVREVPSDAPEHAIQGLVMITIGVLLLAVVEYLAWSRIFPKGTKGSEGGQKPTEPSSDLLPTGGRNLGSSEAARWSFVAVLLVSLAFATGRNSDLFAAEPFEDRLNIERVGLDIDGMNFDARPAGPEFLGTTQFRHRVQRVYRPRPEAATAAPELNLPVRLFLGAENRRQRGETGWSPKTRLPGPSWRQRAFLPPISIDEQTVEREIITYQEGEILVYHWRSGYRGWWRELVQDFLALDATSIRSEGSSVVVRIEVDLPATRQRREEALVRADETARAFAAEIIEDFRNLNEREIRRQRRRRAASADRPGI